MEEQRENKIEGVRKVWEVHKSGQKCKYSKWHLYCALVMDSVIEINSTLVTERADSTDARYLFSL